jgi:hypothetical protein
MTQGTSKKTPRRALRCIGSRVTRAYRDRLRRDNDTILRHQFAALDHGLGAVAPSVLGAVVPVTRQPVHSDPLEAAWRLPALRQAPCAPRQTGRPG